MVRYFLHDMKVMFIIFLTALACMADNFQYEAFKGKKSAKSKHWNNLSKIKLNKTVIEKVHLSEAIFYISKGAEEKRKKGFFDFSISYPMKPGSNPFLESVEDKKKYDPLVSYKKEGISILEAVDSVCKHAGYMWSVNFDSKGKAFLTIEYKTENRPDKTP